VATFLTTPKMPPELAARVRASVRGPRAGKKLSPRQVALLRAGAALAVIGLIAWFVLARRQRARELEAERASVLDAVRSASSELGDAERSMATRARQWLGREDGAYQGDVVSPSLRGAAFAAALGRPMVYVRGPLGHFGSESDLVAVAEASFADAFVLCLVDPPAERTEKSLRARARAVLAGGERVAAIAHVERLHDALHGLRVLQPDWESRLRAAETLREVAVLREELGAAPLEAARRAARAEVLLVATDEPSLGGPTELDGASRHWIRATLMDLASGEVLLRLRTLVDPEWIHPDTRIEWANGITSCEAALDVRAQAAATSG
jgi:hypothetical protein